MSVFNELILTQIFEIQNNTAKKFDVVLKAILESGDRLEKDLLKGRASARIKAQTDKTRITTLQSIHEDDDESSKVPAEESKKEDEGNNNKERVSKKRSKDEVEGMFSPEVDKRQKRSASVKAQSIITKQVNVSLNQKLRRESSMEKSRRERHRDDDKENTKPLPVPVLQIKLEKVSLPPNPTDIESVPVKKEPNKDDIAMPPPTAPVPKPRKAPRREKSADSSEDESGSRKRGNRGRKPTETVPVPEPRETLQKEKSADSSEDESGIRKRSNRGRKPTETVVTPESSEDESRTKKGGSRRRKAPESMPPPPVPLARSTPTSRASSRATRQLEDNKPDDVPPAAELPETRPKRTRGRKKASEVIPPEPEKEAALNDIGSPAEKPRPKRTRRAQKAAEKESQSSQEEVPQSSKPQIPTEEIQTSQQKLNSPVLQKPSKNTKKDVKTKANKKKVENSQENEIDGDIGPKVVLNETRAIENRDLSSKAVLNETRVIENGDMDKTMVLPNGVYNHAPITPKTVNVTSETATCNRDTFVLHSHAINAAMNATVVLDKVPDLKASNLTDDNSLITDDSEPEVRTPPKPIPQPEPSSAVKEKVQQFEELAARTTRTKTRAMAKLEEPENHTPPDRTIKPVLSAETLNKMNTMIFNGKPPQITNTTSSLSKPRVIPPPKPLTASTSKLHSISRHRDAAEEAKREKEDARKKKEAMLEAKREFQKRKREEKMAAAAAAREAAERERKLAMEQAARERMEKQAHANLGKLERLKEVERKKHELARKVAETEERRKAEEQARQQRLAEEQRKAEAARRMQLEEAEAMKKEAALMAKEMEKRQKEYFEKHKLNSKLHTPGYCPQEPVYMADGFEHLHSDDEECTQKTIPAWSTHKMRKLALITQSEVDTKLIDTLFSVQVHSVDLREIFPNIDRTRLKRTSSAVWRTPPSSRLPVLRE